MSICKYLLSLVFYVCGNVIVLVHDNGSLNTNVPAALSLYYKA